MAAHSSVLAWRIPWPEEPGGLQSMGSQELDVCVYACSVPSVVSNSVQLYGLQPARLLSPWDSPGKNTGMGCQALLQGIFLT